MTASRRLGDRYELDEVIGIGATSQVHRGRDLRTGRTVAIKLFRAGLLDLPSVREAAFAQEVRATSRLDHPAIVTIHDDGIEDEDERVSPHR